MSERLSKDKVARILNGIFSCENVVSESINWHRMTSGSDEIIVYVAQSRPSSHGKGNWYYEFWNSINERTIDRILERGASLIQFDYVNRRYCILTEDDVVWAREYSTRNRGERGLVTDFVIREGEGGYYYL